MLYVHVRARVRVCVCVYVPNATWHVQLKSSINLKHQNRHVPQQNKAKQNAIHWHNSQDTLFI